MVVGYNFSCELGRTRGMVISPYQPICLFFQLKDLMVLLVSKWNIMARTFGQREVGCFRASGLIKNCSFCSLPSPYAVPNPPFRTSFGVEA